MANIIQSAISSVRKKASEMFNDNEGWFRGGQFTPVQQIQSIRQQSPVSTFGPIPIPNFQNQQVQQIYKPAIPYLKKFGEGFGESSTYGLIDIPNAPSQNLGQKVAYGVGFGVGILNPINPLNKAMGALNIGEKVIGGIAPKLAPKIAGKALSGLTSELAQTAAYTAAQAGSQALGLRPKEEITPTTFGKNLLLGSVFRAGLSKEGGKAISNVINKFGGEAFVSDFTKVNESLQRLRTMSGNQQFSSQEMDDLVKNANNYNRKYNLMTPKEFSKLNIQKQYDLISNKLENMVRSGQPPIMGITSQAQTRIKTQPTLKDQTQIPKNLLGSVEDNQLPLQSVAQIKKAKQKSFLDSVATSTKTTEPLVEQVKTLEQSYIPLTNKQSTAQASKLIRRSSDEAKALVYSDAPVDALKVTTGIELAKRYEKQGNIDEAVSLINQLDQQLREAGRGIQAASLWNKMAPETMVRTATRIAKNSGQFLPPEIQGNILARMRKVSKMVEGVEKDKATLDVLNYIADNIKPTNGDILDAYRYTNLLSGPRTHERNIYGNLFNTLVTRPLDIALNASYDLLRNPTNKMARDVSFADVPVYYKNVFTSLGNAFSAAQEAMKPGNLKIDQVGAENAIEALRRERVPGVFKAIPKFMEAQDKFFSTLIASGEKARLMARGVEENKASELAAKLAEKYLLREKLGKSESGYLVKALDSAGKIAQNGRKLPVIGKLWSWFVPFVTTPVNFAKMSVEHSILGLPGAKLNSENLAKATAGSLFMAWSANKAMNDDITLNAPTDPKQKELFYAAGKKPFSIRVGDTWVPLQYFGPFGLSMMVPAAIKQRFQDDPGVYTDDVALKATRAVSDISKYLYSQTPLQGVGSLMQLLDGDSDYTLQSILGSMASQAMPLSSLTRWVNTIVDNVYRKGSDFNAQILKTIPWGSFKLEAYTTPTGEPSYRTPTNAFIPYDVGKTNQQYEGLEKQRIQARQDTAMENYLKDQVEKGNVEAGISDKIPYINENGTPTILDLTKFDKIASMPSTNRYETALKESKQYQEAAKIMDNTYLSSSQQDQALKRLGVDTDKAEYYRIANDNTNLKTMFVLDAVNRVKARGGGLPEILRLLAGQRLEVNGQMIASNAVLDNLVDEGTISKDMATEIKKYEMKEGRLSLKKSPKAKKPKLIKIKTYKPKAIKIKRIKVPKLKIVKSRPIKIAKRRKLIGQ